MLPQGFSRTGSALSTTGAAAVGNYCGIGEVAGAAVISASAPDVFPNGVPVVTASQGLATIAYAGRVAPTTVQSGMMTDANGRLVTVTVALAVAPLVATAGYTFDANGALLVP